MSSAETFKADVLEIFVHLLTNSSLLPRLTLRCSYVHLTITLNEKPKKVSQVAAEH